MDNTKLEIIPIGIESITFKIGDAEKNLDLGTVSEVIQHLKFLIDYMEHYKHYVRMYKDYSEAIIDEELDKEESEFDDTMNEYRVGCDFNTYCNILDDKILQSITNDNASKLFKAQYEKVYGKSTLIFDPERSFCYVYTKDKKEAKQFLLFTYNKVIKPALEKVQMTGKV